MEFSYKQETFKYSFFPVGVRESNNFRISKCGAKSIKQLISMLMQFFKLKQRSIFSIHNQIGVKLPRGLQLRFGKLGGHKFCHGLGDCMSPMCNCGAEVQAKLFSCIANSFSVVGGVSMATFVWWVLWAFQRCWGVCGLCPGSGVGACASFTYQGLYCLGTSVALCL